MRWPLLLLGSFALTIVLSPSAAAQDEAARLEAHFREVEGELLARDVDHLTPAQREARARHVRVLREYRERGIFPHNHDFRGERRPYFVDRHGTLCAMAYLIARSGRTDLVERVAAGANHAYLPELARDPELRAWLEEAGLTVEEAARIQPTYGYREDGDVTPEYAYASVLTMGLEGGLVAWNLARSPADRGRGVRGAAGVAGGALGMVVGAVSVFGGNGDHTLGKMNAYAGAASVVLGLRTLLAQRGGERVPVDPPAGAGAAVTAAPWVGRGGEAGVALRLRF